MSDHRALITQLCDELDHNRRCLLDDRRVTHPLADRARAALAADGPAVPEGREPASVVEQPSDAELLEINYGAYCPCTDEVNDEDDSSWQYTSDYIRWLDENGTPEEQGAYAAKGLRAVFEAGRRYGRQPAPPAAGEDKAPAVTEVIAWLCTEAEIDDGFELTQSAAYQRRAADLLEQRHPTPVPVSERLPGDQLCWWYEPDEDDDGSGYGGKWTLLRIRGGTATYTHWLPAHALPVPQQ